MHKLTEKNILLHISFILIAIIAALHLWALDSHFYFLYWWFDIIMHFLGGLWVGITFFWLYNLWFLGYFKSNKKLLWSSISVLLIVAIGWEVFEMFTQRTYEEPNFITDTSGDIILGMLGTFIAYKYFVLNFLEKHNAK